MSTKGTIAVKGLRTSGNRLSAGPGTFTEALNCVITSRDTLSTRRGAMQQDEYASQYIDGDATDASSNRAKELYQWGTALLVSYTGSGGYKLASFATFGTSPTRALVGSFAPPDPTRLRMKFAQLAQSLYWTTDAGLYALDVVGGTARLAGRARPCIILTDPDAGLGTRLSGNPSATGSWFVKDQTVAYRATCGKRDANGIVIESAASPRQIVVNPKDVVAAIGGLSRTGTTVTATVAAHKFRPNDVFALSPGEANFAAGNYTVTSVTATTVVWTNAGAAVVSTAQETLSSGTKSIRVAVMLPADAAAGDFVRLYRTDEAAGEAIDPGDECFLSYERVVTSTDVSNTYAVISDTTPSDFLNDPLDSNANSGDGALGENTQPPLCDDLCLWDGTMWGGKTTDRHRLRLRLLGIGSPNGLQTGDTLAINTRVYVADSDFTAFTQYLPTENVDRTAASISRNVYFDLRSVGLNALNSYDGDTGLGEVVIEQSTPASTMADGSSGAISAIYAATSRAGAWGDALAATKAITSANTSRTSNVVTVRCVGHGFSQGQVVMIAYSISNDLDANFHPGLKTITQVVDADNFKYAESGSNATLGAGAVYYAYATTYKSDNNQQPVRFSRPGLPDAWPLVNTLGGLPDGADVLRIAPSGSGYSLLVFLKDGAIYRVSGEYPYSVRRLDDTASLVAADSLVPHSGRLHGLTTQGICAITEAGVALLGPDVEDITRVVVNGILGGALNASLVFGTSYESERQYMLSMPQEVAGSPGTITSTNYQTLSLNSLTGDFARESWQRTCGLVFRGRDFLVMGDANTNMLRIERKGLDGTEFCDARSTLTANGTQTNVSTIVINSTTAPSAGDILRNNSDYFVVTAGTATSVTISGTTSANNFDTLYLYRSYQTQFTFTPDTGGIPGVEKRWREVQLHFGKSAIRTLTVTFANEHGATGSVTSTDSTYAITSGASAFPVGTLSANVVRRIEVPHAVQRCAMLIVTVTIQEAGNFFDLYGISATFENVSERTGK